MLVTDDQTKLRIPLYVSGRVIQKLSVAPAAVFFGKVAVGEQVAKKVVVRGSKPFRIRSVESDKEGFHFRTDDTQSKRHILEIGFHSPQEIGLLKGSIRIATDLGYGEEATLTAHATVLASGPSGPTVERENRSN